MPLFRLATFGGLSLAAAVDPLRTTQRRRLALLALLAVAGERGLSRDKLQAYLWPESRADQARHALEQLLYFLRRQLGDDAFLGTNPLALNPAVIGSDVAEFQRALEGEALEEAVAFYRGPFLDGFFLSDAPEFERWMETERAELAQRCKGALESLARRDAKRDVAASLEWWRRLVAMDPYASGPTLGLMNALAATGNRAGALEAARLHQTLLQKELNAVPNPEVAALAEQVRTGQLVARGPFVRHVSEQLRAAPASGAQEQVETEAVAALPAVAAPPIGPTAHRVTVRRPLVPRVALIVSLILPLGLALTLARHQNSGRNTALRLDPARILVMPFQVTGRDSSLQYLSEGMVDLITAKLAGGPGAATVDPRTALSSLRRVAHADTTDPRADGSSLVARSFGAGKILSGDMVETAPGHVVLDGIIRSTADGKVLGRATASGSLDTLPALVDRLAASLLVSVAGESETRLAELTSASLPAVRAYLQGRAAYREGDSKKALADYTRALELDSTFTLAALELISAADMVLHWGWGGSVHGVPFGRTIVDAEAQETWARALQVAWKGRERLNRSDRAYLFALVGSHYPYPSSARERLGDWERALDASPDRADAWYRLAQVLCYQGPSVGLSDWPGRARAAYRRAWGLDSSFVAPLAGLLELAARVHDTTEARRLAGLYLARDSSTPTAEYVRWHAAALAADAAALESLRGRWDSLRPETLDRIQWTSQMEGIEVDDADRALAALLDRSAGAGARGGAAFALTMLHLNQGRPRAALRDWQRITDYVPDAYLHRNLQYALYWEGDSTLAAATVPARPDALWWTTQWRLWHGDTVGVAAAIKSMRKVARTTPDPLFPAQAAQPIYVDAILASATHREDAPALLRQADSMALLGCCSLPHHGNLIVARLHEMAGDLPGALEAVRRQKWWYPPEYLSTALEEEGRLAALTGDTASAIRSYRHYLALRAHPEPERRREVERVRAELAKLEQTR